MHRQRRIPKQSRSKQTLDVIYQGCLRALGEHGFSRVTTRLIARVAGVGVGTLYRYFSDREAVFSEMFTEMARRLVADILPPPGEVQGPLPVAEFTERVLRRFVDRLREHRTTVAELARNRHRFETRQQQLQRHQAFQRAIAELLREHLNVEDPMLAAFIVQRAVDGVVVSALIDRPEMLDDDRLLNELIRLIGPYLESCARLPAQTEASSDRDAVELRAGVA
ncbi:MAG: TetR/AcrR family transcriptional regulator [Deltaproteobacteria bacterium]|nr:TetR/AcrR family transcriptional regulator [Deltaproteobacteria bacterium]